MNCKVKRHIRRTKKGKTPVRHHTRRLKNRGMGVYVYRKSLGGRHTGDLTNPEIAPMYQAVPYKQDLSSEKAQIKLAVDLIKEDLETKRHDIEEVRVTDKNDMMLVHYDAKTGKTGVSPDVRHHFEEALKSKKNMGALPTQVGDYKVKYVAPSILKDYAGMNAYAAKDIGFPKMNKNTILIDKDMTVKDKLETLNHELHEVEHMKKGKSYWEAHKIALKKEKGLDKLKSYGALHHDVARATLNIAENIPPVEGVPVGILVRVSENVPLSSPWFMKRMAEGKWPYSYGARPNQNIVPYSKNKTEILGKDTSLPWYRFQGEQRRKMKEVERARILRLWDSTQKEKPKETVLKLDTKGRWVPVK